MSKNTLQEYSPILGIYFGPRNDTFKSLIISLLNKAKIKDKFINPLITPEALQMFSDAFTSDLVDENNNYQVYEQLGDLIGNKFIVWYMYRRFPQLKCAEGVKVAARLRINYGAKNSFSKIAEKLGFWPFITAPNDLRSRKQKDLLEDVFEAFLGVTALVLDESFNIGVGDAIVYRILKSIFDDMDISLRYEDLYDAKTRLKELFDIHEEILGPLKYETSRREEDGVAISQVYRVENGSYFVKKNGKKDKKRIVGGTSILIGSGEATLEAEAEQLAASEGLKTMKSYGYYKVPPKCYRKFMNEEIESNNKLSSNYIASKYGEDINALVKTKGKSKYQCRYESTVIAMYCRERNIEGVKICLKMGADIKIPDTDGMFPLDLLFIGKIDEKIVKPIFQILEKSKQKLYMNNNVMETFYEKYQSYFIKKISKIDLVEHED